MKRIHSSPIPRLVARVVLVASALCLAPSLAFAGEGVTGEARKDIAETGAWEVGVRGHFVTADPILGFFYEKKKSVNGYTMGGTLTRRNPHGTRLIVGVDYTAVDPVSAAWLEQGEDPPAAEWVEFHDFRIVSVNIMVGHEWGEGRAFGFFMGGGVGAGFVLGDITKYPTLAPGFTQKDPAGAPDEINIPPVAPTILFRMGPTVSIGGKGSISFDAGIHNGLYIGTTIGARF